jgi:hypothetical protein
MQSSFNETLLQAPKSRRKHKSGKTVLEFEASNLHEHPRTPIFKTRTTPSFQRWIVRPPHFILGFSAYLQENHISFGPGMSHQKSKKVQGRWAPPWRTELPSESCLRAEDSAEVTPQRELDSSLISVQTLYHVQTLHALQTVPWRRPPSPA